MRREKREQRTCPRPALASRCHPDAGLAVTPGALLCLLCSPSRLLPARLPGLLVWPSAARRCRHGTDGEPVWGGDVGQAP